MKTLLAITAFLNAGTAAMRVFPMWLAWRVTGEIESLTERILKHEVLNTASDRRLADELRLALLYRKRLHDSLLATAAAVERGDKANNA
jgi:hypothetical protein